MGEQTPQGPQHPIDEPAFGPFSNYFYLDGVLEETVLSSQAVPDPEVVGTLYITYHENCIYGIVGGGSLNPTWEDIVSPSDLILSNVNAEYTGSFFENLHGEGTPENPYYLVENEVLRAGYWVDSTTYHTSKEVGMTITITNGTLAQMQERLIPASGYGSPRTAAIVGADYTLTDGVLTLEPTGTTITITASGRVPIAVLDLDSLELPVGTYTITTKAKAANYRDSEASNTVTYVVQPELDTPTNLSVTDTTASFDEVENAEKYEFFVDDVSIGEYPTVTIIEFTIRDTTYQAEQGMTWEQWVGSEYNTSGFSLSGNNVMVPGTSERLVAILNTAVLKTDTIIANQAYVTVNGGGD